jgi:hypothetical protein
MIDVTNSLLSDAQGVLREQLNAAWQLHIERIQAVVAARWPEEIDRILEERLADLAERLDAGHRADSDARAGRAASEAKVSARRELTASLNQTARRLRSFESETQWASVLIEAAREFCERAAIFRVAGGRLRLLDAHGLDTALTEEIPLASAPAFASAVESKDTVVAMRTKSELSEPIAGLAGHAEDQRFSLFPLVTRQGVAAVLYADSGAGKVDDAGLELLASIAAPALETRAPSSAERSDLISITGAASKPISSWFALPKEEQDIHLRAQRFARVQVAEMRLYRAREVREGRANRDLYAALKPEIDSGREIFRRDYLGGSPNMVDYFHLELVQTLANDDANLLGPQYPGQLA